MVDAYTHSWLRNILSFDRSELRGEQRGHGLQATIKRDLQ